MTDEEFQRLKEAEKEHLREKKRMRRVLHSLKKRHKAQGIVQQMKQGAQRLLRETESLVDSLRAQVAQNEAQLEVAAEEQEAVEDLQEAEEALKEERAESLLRQYKAATGTTGTSSPTRQPGKQGDETSAPKSSREGPEKTIGRMRTPRSDDEDE